MKRSESISAIAAALAKAQGELEPVVKSVIGQVGRAEVRYADLAAILHVMRKPFSENGLAYTQSIEVDDKDVIVTTLLMHASGEWMESSMAAAFEPATAWVSHLQQIGRASTYLRRYAMQALAGISAERDDDAAPTERQERQERPQRAPHELVEPLKALSAEKRVSVKAMLDIASDSTLADVLKAFDALDDGKKALVKQFVSNATPTTTEERPPNVDEDGEIDRGDSADADNFDAVGADGYGL